MSACSVVEPSVASRPARRERPVAARRGHLPCAVAMSLGLLGVLPPATAQPAEVESCVSVERIAWGAGAERVLLDDADRAQVLDAALARYPMLQRDGFAPTHIALWHRPGGDWVYVSLLADPAQPGAYCYTATFTAAVFDITPALLRKYFALRST